jgi:hypothetical protein
VSTAAEDTADTPEDPAAGAPFTRSFVLRCADVHPVRCGEEWQSSRRENLVAAASAHGARAHGFTPVWYSPERIVAMTAAVTER